MGFLDLDGGLGRRFGSLGLALSAPETRLRLGWANEIICLGAERERAAQIATTLLARFNLRRGLRVEIDEAIPAHSGLGSGTQLALALAAGLRHLAGLAANDAEDAAALGRGQRSGIGASLFAAGGFVVDGGRGALTQVPPLLAHQPFPPEWVVILVEDRSRHGLSGGAERAAFQHLPPFGAAAAGEACRLLLMQILPGLIEADMAAFGAGVTRLQQMMGAHFADAQGGRFTSTAVGGAMAALASAGACGIGQSSWGPTGFAFARHEAEARTILGQKNVAAATKALHVSLVRGHNQGATIIETSGNGP
ncbi:MAG: GHMP kinase [Hyphomicrobiales bacterium]|nr:GHMP kinase [Hyphomicrobiales bacterium]